MIRFATKYDNDAIIDMMKQFAIKANYDMAKNPLNWSRTYIEKVLYELYAGKGFVLIDEAQTGILIAVKSPSFWIPNFIQLQEVMLFGKNKIVIGRLIKSYIKISKDLIASNEINEAVMASYNNCNYEKLNMVQFEKHWKVA